MPQSRSETLKKVEPQKSQELRADVEQSVVDALDAYASDEAMTRSQALGVILADWLRTHGYGPAGSTKPEGPATKIVEAMDAAIQEHKKAKRR